MRTRKFVIPSDCTLYLFSITCNITSVLHARVNDIRNYFIFFFQFSQNALFQRTNPVRIVKTSGSRNDLFSWPKLSPTSVTRYLIAFAGNCSLEQLLYQLTECRRRKRFDNLFREVVLVIISNPKRFVGEWKE